MISDRRARKTPRRDCMPNRMKLTKAEEQVLIKHILELDARGFPPTLAAVKDMADQLLTTKPSLGEYGFTQEPLIQRYANPVATTPGQGKPTPPIKPKL